MTWTKLDDGIFDHPKMLRAGEDAANLYVRALVWCNKHLTDGQIPREALRALTLRRSPESMADRLVTVGLWEATGEGWFVHDFAAHNPSRATVEAKRAELSAKRSEAGKKGGKRSGEVRGPEAKGKQVASSVSKQKATPDPSSPSYSPEGADGADADPLDLGEQPEKPKPARGGNPLPFGPEAALGALADSSGGRFSAPETRDMSKGLRGQIVGAIRSYPDLAEWERLGEWLKAGGLSKRLDVLGASWAASAGLRECMGHAREWEAKGRPSLRLVDTRNPSLFDPKPAPAARVVKPGDLNADLDAYVRSMK